MVQVSKQVYRPVGPNIDAAAKGSISDRIDWMKAIHGRITELERKLGAQGSDSDRQSPVAPVPPRAKFTVTFASGFFTIQITNPENTKHGNNPIHTPIKHLLKSSLTASFDGQGSVLAFGPSTQTHWSIQGSGARWWQLTSSFDGATFNSPTLHGAVGS